MRGLYPIHRFVLGLGVFLKFQRGISAILFYTQCLPKLIPHAGLLFVLIASCKRTRCILVWSAVVSNSFSCKRPCYLVQVKVNGHVMFSTHSLFPCEYVVYSDIAHYIYGTIIWTHMRAMTSYLYNCTWSNTVSYLPHMSPCPRGIT